MPKRFDCEDGPNEFMDMPCRCNCGNWFDLNDGHTVGDKIVCRECKDGTPLDEDGDDDYDNWDDENHPLNPPKK